MTGAPARKRPTALKVAKKATKVAAKKTSSQAAKKTPQKKTKDTQHVIPKDSSGKPVALNTHLTYQLNFGMLSSMPDILQDIIQGKDSEDSRSFLVDLMRDFGDREDILTIRDAFNIRSTRIAHKSEISHIRSFTSTKTAKLQIFLQFLYMVRYWVVASNVKRPCENRGIIGSIRRPYSTQEDLIVFDSHTDSFVLLPGWDHSKEDLTEGQYIQTLIDKSEYSEMIASYDIDLDKYFECIRENEEIRKKQEAADTQTTEEAPSIQEFHTDSEVIDDLRSVEYQAAMDAMQEHAISPDIYELLTSLDQYPGWHHEFNQLLHGTKEISEHSYSRVITPAMEILKQAGILVEVFHQGQGKHYFIQNSPKSNMFIQAFVEKELQRMISGLDDLRSVFDDALRDSRESDIGYTPETRIANYMYLKEHVFDQDFFGKIIQLKHDLAKAK